MKKKPAANDVYTRAMRQVVRQDPDLRSLLKAVQIVPRTHHADPYGALVRAIAHQMVHGNAAKACLRRLVEASGEVVRGTTRVPSAQSVVKLGMSGIRACGFSNNKTRAIYELAQKKVDGTLPSVRQLRRMSDGEIIKALVPLCGVGRWTVEMYLIFSLGRMDVFPVDDFGVREGYRIWKKETVQQKPKELARIAVAWAPNRTIVALACWALADQYKKIT